MEWAKSEDTIIHLGCSITNFSQTTLLSMVLHLHAWQMHVFLYFLGPTYFHLFFHVFFFSLVGCPKGRWLATQSTPLGSTPASSHRCKRPTKPIVYVLCLTLLCCITDNAKPDNTLFQRKLDKLTNHLLL